MYFPKSYFAPTYFAFRTGPKPGTARAYQPSDGFDAILDLLESSGDFAAVGLGESAAIEPEADGWPIVALIPERWSEVDDVLSGYRLRRVEYRLVLRVRDEDPGTRLRRLDQLADAIQDALEGSDLGGCLPGQSRLDRNSYAARQADGDQQITLSGEFVYRRPLAQLQS